MGPFLYLAANALSDWQVAATDAAMRHAGYIAIEQKLEPASLRWSALLPDVSASWTSRDQARIPLDDSSGSAYTSRGEGWQLRASWNLSRLVRDDMDLQYVHTRMQLSGLRRGLALEVARALSNWCEGAERAAAEAQLLALTGGWSRLHPPPASTCGGQQVSKYGQRSSTQ